MIRFARGLLALGFMCAMVASSTAAAAAPGTTIFSDDTATDTPTATSTTTPTATPTPDVPAMLQQVIQHSNDEQVQALAQGNVSLMADTMTADHFQDVSTAFLSMMKNDVAGVTLLELDWGPIAVAPDGASATVTTWETWRTTTLSGLTVDEVPMRNDYTLVLDNGAWKVKSDAQVQQTPPPSPTPTVTPTVTLTPTITSTPTATATATSTPTPGTAPADIAPGDNTSPADIAPDDTTMPSDMPE